jgi:hypothetical protein
LKNFHLPLPESTYALLRREQARKAKLNAIAKYAAEMAGTELDLDRELETAGIEHLTRPGVKKK